MAIHGYDTGPTKCSCSFVDGDLDKIRDWILIIYEFDDELVVVVLTDTALYNVTLDVNKD